MAKHIYTLAKNNNNSNIEDKLLKESLALKGILKFHSVDTISFNDYDNREYKTSNAYTETRIVITGTNGKEHNILFNGNVPESFGKEPVEYSHEFKDVKKVDELQYFVTLYQSLRLDKNSPTYECHKHIKFSKYFNPDKFVSF